jgi:hypothetical protein
MRHVEKCGESASKGHERKAFCRQYAIRRNDRLRCRGIRNRVMSPGDRIGHFDAQTLPIGLDERSS